MKKKKNHSETHIFGKLHERAEPWIILKIILTNQTILIIRNYLSDTLQYIDQYLTTTKKLQSIQYIKFGKKLKHHRKILKKMYTCLNRIGDFHISSQTFGQIGYVLKCFYEIYEDPIYNKSMLYSFGFIGYINNLRQISILVKSGKLNKASYSNNLKTNIDQLIHPIFISQQSKKDDPPPIYNNIILDRNIIITGPNASGKTTTIKSIFISLLMSQQFGFGCYKSINFKPFQQFHCYINIPDTIDRDSLFQAEARRCKYILDAFESSGNDRHFCIFDELFSGTNPEEAVGSAIAFTDFINQTPNIIFALTTHYRQIPAYFKPKKYINNWKMTAHETASSIKYTYMIAPGVSKINGGYRVLKDMNFPTRMLQKIQTKLY